ncbi:MAG: cytochrome c biogenesis protein [Alphaproteobacteria bacterium]
MITRLLLILITCTCFCKEAYASQKLNMQSFSQIPILEEGRIKPLATFARTQLKTISGKTSWQGQSAAQWLAETLFNPSDAIEQEIIHIDNDTVKTRLALPLEKDHFSLTELQSGLQATREDAATLMQSTQDTLTKDQTALLATHEKAILFTQTLRSLSMILPLNIEIPEEYADKNPKNTTYKAILPIKNTIEADLKNIIRKKGENFDKYTEKERTTALLSFQLTQIQNGGHNNTILRILPSDWSGTTAQNWYSPWQILQNGQGSPTTAHTLQIWQDMAMSYRSQNTKLWDITSAAALTATLNATSISQTRLKTEILYQSAQPYTIAMALYGLSITFLLFSFSRNIGLTTLTLAATLHITAIAARVYILDRPPVGTLYESVIFVSLICALAGLWGGIKHKNPPTALSGSIAALALLATAPIMLKGNDSFELLVAVLNTNFWLTTHVLIITAGYGVCIIAALMAHFYMIARIRKKDKPSLAALHKSIHKTTLLALFLTAFGTVLGGIWADQSWGRFWGWDPKENGALLIVLWLIWAQHARLSGHMRDLHYCASIAYLGVIVAVSWFGVNLLGVGLHSYGFTSGLATGLIAFCTLSTGLIAALWITVRKAEKS